MNIKKIKAHAKNIMDEKENETAVSRYIDLIEMEKQTLKQLKQVRATMKKFEENPEEFCEENENLW